MARPAQPDLEQPDGGATATEANAEAATTVEPTTAAVAIPAARRKKPRVFYWLAVGWLALIVLCALTADFLPIDDPNFQTVTNRLSSPGENGYLLGADPLGRDILSRLIFGARVSLIVALSGVVTGSIIGGAIGLTAGFFRGWYERVVMTVIDVILAFPGLVLLLALVAFVGQDLRTIALVVGFLAVPGYARIARGTTLAVSQREYVMAASALGAKSSRILFRELLPNVALPVLAFGLVALGLLIVAEGSLAFLGLSVEFPTATWGSMIADGKIHIRRAPHVAMIPSFTMLLTVLSVNYVGDSLRSRFDVREGAL